MEVQKSNSPSYGWKSILVAQDLLREGRRKLIGSGYNTQVWLDPWIPTIPARPALDIGVYRDQNMFVNQIINQSSKQWRIDLLEALTDSGDISLIKNIRPSHNFQDDGYIWIHKKSGLYTVKSRYKLANQLKEDKREQAFSEPSIEPLKAMILKLKAPRKILHFLWQVLSGCIATCARLVDRHYGNDRTCPKCGDSNKSINHLIFLCPPAIQTWALSDIPSSPGLFPRDSVYNNFDYLLLRAKHIGTPENVLAQFPWIVWFIWKAMNEKTFNGKQTSPIDTVLHASREEENWWVAQNILEVECRMGNPTSEDRNRESETQLPRCQVDASWAKNSIVSGGGFVFDLEYETHWYGSIGMNQVLSPMHVEFTILLYAMRSSLQQGITPMSFESDCLQLVKLINDEEDWPAMASEWNEFIHLLPFLHIFSLSFIARERIIRADCLAKDARSQSYIFSYVNSEIPGWLPQQANLFLIN